MATLNLGRIKPVFRGAYSGSTAYVVDDIVTHGNESFICIQAHGAGTQATSQAAYWTKLAAKGTDGTDVGTTITTQGDILYRDGSGLQRLAKGTAGQALKMNTAANAPEWGTISSDYVKLGQANAANASGVSFDGLFAADYKIYKIYGYDIYSHVSGNDLQFRVQTDGSADTASNYVNTNWYTYTDTTPSHTINTQSSGSNDVNSPASAWKINVDSFSNVSTRPSFFEMTIADPQQDSKYKMATWNHMFTGENADIMQQGQGFGQWKSNNDISGIQIQGQAGNITGNFTMYGIKV
mgnify:CR=1 FL=1